MESSAGGNATPDWAALIAEASTGRVVARRALRHEGGIPTATQPQKYACDDASLYLVKFCENGHGNGHGIFAEEVVALAGRLIGAPVPQVDLVHVSNELIAGLSLPFVPGEGAHHGSAWADGYSDRNGVAYVDENRERFGALDVLYAWLFCNGDQQYIYRNAAPHEVLSVDHSTFFPGGPQWSEASLQSPPGVARDPVLAAIDLQPEHRAAALAKLGAVSPTDIARVVARPPDEWGVSEGERVALAEYIAKRQNETIQFFGP